MVSTSGCILEKLKANKPDFQELQLSSAQAALLDCEGLVQALKQNRTVKRVHIDGFFVDQLFPRSSNPIVAPNEQPKTLWQTLGSLPKIHELHLAYFVRSAVTLEVLDWVLGRATGLKKLCLHDCRIFLDSSDTFLGATSLKNHDALREIRISQVRPYNRETTRYSSATLDPLFEMVLSAPTLCKLSICPSVPNTTFISYESIGRLGAKSRLMESLNLQNVVFDNHRVVHFMQQLVAAMQTDGRDSVANKCVEGFRNLVLDTSQSILNQDACLAIATLLRHKDSKLENLCLFGSQIDEDGLVAIASSLKLNQRLRVLQLGYNSITSRGYNALIDMLRENCYLESMLLSRGFLVNAPDSDAFLRVVNFYLNLNTACIRRLLLDVNVDRDQIFDKLVVHAENVDYLFHILRGNPSFLSIPAS